MSLLKFVVFYYLINSSDFNWTFAPLAKAIITPHVGRIYTKVNIMYIMLSLSGPPDERLLNMKSIW